MVPDTGTPFIDLPEILLNNSTCGSCSLEFSIKDSLTHYPVRVPCGDVFCYGCVDAWLWAYKRDCPRCNGPFGDIALAREHVESQIDHCRKALEMEQRLLALSYDTAKLSLKHSEVPCGESRSPSETEEQLESLSEQMAEVQLQVWEDDSTGSISDIDLVENVIAALSSLDIAPERAAELDLGDLVETLSVLDLSPGSSATRLMHVLQSISK